MYVVCRESCFSQYLNSGFTKPDVCQTVLSEVVLSKAVYHTEQRWELPVAAASSDFGPADAADPAAVGCQSLPRNSCISGVS